MKGLILALVLQGAAPGGQILQGAALGGGGSLGIGIDVLPEAFSFAASRVRYAPELRLTHCGSTACRWHLGEGVEMTASLSQSVLDVGRIEAQLAAPASAEAAAGYRKACLAIVALFDPDASDERRRTIAAAIAAPPAGKPEVALNAGGGASFYGAPRRCGVAAFSMTP